MFWFRFRHKRHNLVQETSDWGRSFVLWLLKHISNSERKKTKLSLNQMPFIIKKSDWVTDEWIPTAMFLYRNVIILISERWKQKHWIYDIFLWLNWIYVFLFISALWLQKCSDVFQGRTHYITDIGNNMKGRTNEQVGRILVFLSFFLPSIGWMWRPVVSLCKQAFFLFVS